MDVSRAGFDCWDKSNQSWLRAAGTHETSLTGQEMVA